MAKQPLLPVETALSRILSGVFPLTSETVPLMESVGRTLAADIVSTRTQPPFATSAMDGYAVRAADVEVPGRSLNLVGRSVAGKGFAGAVGPGETVRIFTGAPLPEGADTILIQENAKVSNGIVVNLQAEPLGRFVRPAGLDFRAGDCLLKQGQRVGAREIALAAAMNHARLPVVRKPVVAILATGDELVPPGVEPAPDQIVASNTYAIAAAVAAAGGAPHLLGIAGDSRDSLHAAFGAARAVAPDILVTVGGASVGEHDLVQEALGAEGMTLDFWRIAMRPGKPMMVGALDSMRVLGLPGNPVSSMVCTLIFLLPLVRALLGRRDGVTTLPRLARSEMALAANDERQDYLRARIVGEIDGLPLVVAHGRQDSSMLSVLGASDCLIVRPPHAEPAPAGAFCQVLMLDLLDR